MARKTEGKSEPSPVRERAEALKALRAEHKRPEAGDTVTCLIRTATGHRMEEVTITRERTVPSPKLGASEKLLRRIFSKASVARARAAHGI